MGNLINRAFAPFHFRLVRTRAMRDPVELFVLKAHERGVRTVLDVGANVGQFIHSIRAAGYSGRAVSFEPLKEAHRQLELNASTDPDWFAGSRAAVGATAGQATINVSGNSVSSSLLPVEAASTDTLAETAYVASEIVETVRLDDALDAAWEGPYAIKIDTQGFELEVLRGAPRVLAQTAVIVVELSLAELYTGGARIHEIFAHLESAGFRAIAITEGFSDYSRNEMLQVDAVFVSNIGSETRTG